MKSVLSFLQAYFMAIFTLAIALVVLFFIISQARRLPAPVSTGAEKLGALVTGNAYHFDGV